MTQFTPPTDKRVFTDEQVVSTLDSLRTRSTVAISASERVLLSETVHVLRRYAAVVEVARRMREAGTAPPALISRLDALLVERSRPPDPYDELRPPARGRVRRFR